MITGVHTIIYSADAESDKAFFKNVLKLANVDVHDGWLIFALPPSELAIHPSINNGQQMFLMCEDIHNFKMEMESQNILCSKIQEQNWGALITLTLPGGSQLGVYEPKHPRPLQP